MRSRKEADATLRVLSARRVEGPIASIDDARIHALLLRLAEVMADEREVYEAKLLSLMKLDASKNAGYLETLTTFLQTFGDINAASERLSVHPNTVRYRLQKLQELVEIDLKDPRELLSLTILLSALSEREVL